MSGRKPMGPQLVQHLDGSEQAKERLEVILETIAGNLKVQEACQRLGIKEAMFHRLRMRVLEAALSDLEPRLRGRPRRELSQQEQENEQLADRLKELKGELQIADVRRELAETLPHLLQDELEQDEQEALKKTNPKKWRKRRRRAVEKLRRKPR